MKNRRIFKMILLFLVFNLVNVIAKKKSQIIILGGGGGSPPATPYIHHTSQGAQSPQIIPFPIPIFLPMQQPMQQQPMQQPMMPPIFLPMQSPIQQTPVQPTYISSPSPTTQHIYHHHQNSSPQVHFIQLPVYKRDRYVQQPEYTTSTGHYQSSDHYPVYSDYSYDSTSSNMHRRKGLEFESFIPVHHFVGNHNYFNRPDKINMMKKRKPKNDLPMIKKKCKNHLDKNYSDNLDKSYSDNSDKIYLSKSHLNKNYLDKSFTDKDYIDKHYLDRYPLDKHLLDKHHLDRHHLDSYPSDKHYLDRYPLDKPNSVKYDLDTNREAMIKK